MKRISILFGAALALIFGYAPRTSAQEDGDFEVFVEVMDEEALQGLDDVVELLLEEEDGELEADERDSRGDGRREDNHEADGEVALLTADEEQTLRSREDDMDGEPRDEEEVDGHVEDEDVEVEPELEHDGELGGDEMGDGEESAALEDERSDSEDAELDEELVADGAEGEESAAEDGTEI